MRFLAAAFALALLASPAWAQPSDELQQARDEIVAETRGSVFPGPREGETRAVWVWRPANAGTQTLPVLYMADGLGGLRVALLRLKPLIASGQIQPFMIVAPDPNPDGQQRAAEYLRGWPGGSDDFALYQHWFIEQVIPWAERTQRAARDREHRFVGGFSNGADLAIVLAVDHPDLFGGALVHSPVGASASWVASAQPGQRWVVSEGTQEVTGSIHRPAQLGRNIARSLERKGIPVRVCLGRWAHEGPAWRDLSPGSVVWMMRLGDYQAVTTQLERDNCRINPGSGG